MEKEISVLSFKNYNKREKFSIRKYKTIGAASAVIGTLFLAGGAVHASDENLDNITSNSTPPHPNTIVDAGVSVSTNKKDNAIKNEPEHKGDIVKENQPGITVPKGNEVGADDQNANVRYNAPKSDASVEELTNIIKSMPDDFQNNEKSYLRNIEKLGQSLRFDKTKENPKGVPLQPGEIRELEEFGGWHAIDKEGNRGKFVIGRRNEQGYFVGWHKTGQTSDGLPIIEQGGMLGADVLDNLYVHEQALDRRYEYILALAKGRDIANRTEKVVDNSDFDIRAINTKVEDEGKEWKSLSHKQKHDLYKYSPNVVGYNGIEKEFKAFATDYGSRIKVGFATGYLSEFNEMTGGYRVIVKTKNVNNEEEVVYDETIRRVKDVVQNGEMVDIVFYDKINKYNLRNIFEEEFNFRVFKIHKEFIKNSVLNGKVRHEYTEEDKRLSSELRDKARSEALKQGDIVLDTSSDILSISNSRQKDSEFRRVFNTQGSAESLANLLNNLVKISLDEQTDGTPAWLSQVVKKAKVDSRAYDLLNYLIPGVKKLIYHVNTDQLEVQTDKYSYIESRDALKKNGVQASEIDLAANAEAYGITEEEYNRLKTNTRVNELHDGWAKFTSEKGDDVELFTRYIEKEKGFVRRNVLSEDEVSREITKKIDGNSDNLAQSGYFSSTDITLKPDVVSYKVQILPADELSVGVNSQSHRSTWNAPIMGDFSVIQDTVGPMKDLARKIVSKLKEEGKITEDKEKELIEKIVRTKKSSEVRSLITEHNVSVLYQDENGRILKPKTAPGEVQDDGSYVIKKNQTIGSDYNVSDKKLKRFTTEDGKSYRLKSVTNDDIIDGRLKSSDSDSGSIVDKDILVKYVYEEFDPSTIGRGVVHFKKELSNGNVVELPGYNDVELEGDVGSEFSSEDVANRIKELKGKGYEVARDTFTNGARTIDTIADTDTPSQVYEVVVREGMTDEGETSRVTEVVKYVDASDETITLKSSDIHSVEISRINKRSKVTGQIEYGKWSEATMTSVSAPRIEGYGSPTPFSIPEIRVTEPRDNMMYVLRYPKMETGTEEKVVTRTINYLEKGTNKVLKEPTVQTHTLTRSKTTNKVTGEVTYGEWSKGSWSEVRPERIPKHKEPSLEVVEAKEVPLDNETVNVYYEIEKGSVVTNYYIENTTTKLADSVSQSNLDVDSTYNTTGKEIEPKVTEEDREDRVIKHTTRYELVGTPTNASGKVTSGEIVVNYYYRAVVDKVVIMKQAPVTVHYYKDGTTEKLADSIEQGKKDIGSKYTTEAKVIEPKVTVQDLPEKTVTTTTRYELKEVPKDKDGVVPVGGKVVTYYYVEKVDVKEVAKQAPVTVHYYKDGTTEKLAESIEQGKKDIGSKYTTEALRVIEEKLKDGSVRKWLLKAVPFNANGDVKAGGTTVIYYYMEFSIPKDVPVVELPEYNPPKEEPKVEVPKVQPKPLEIPKPTPVEVPKEEPKVMPVVRTVEPVVQQKVLPNTGSETTNTAGLGLGVIAVGAVMVKQRRKLGKRQ